MRTFALILLYTSRSFAITAVLAGTAAGLLVSSIVAGLTCFDTCPTPDTYFSRIVPGTAWVMQPFAAVEALAFITFVAYCLARKQGWRVIKQTLALLIGALLAAGTLYAVLNIAQAMLVTTAYGLIDESFAVRWMSVWGLRSWSSRALGQASLHIYNGPLNDDHSLVMRT